MKTYQWAIIGAGPAGIAVVGKLIDSGVDPRAIVWFDPNFSVGDFGTKWRNVPSNTKVHLFKKFLSSCRSFEFDRFKNNSLLLELPEDDTCQLSVVADMLQQISDQLEQSVEKIQSNVTELSDVSGEWQIKTEEQHYAANNVVLAVGSVPIQLDYQVSEVIPLEMAMDVNRLEKVISPDDVVAVFGSSHSAILAIRNLVENTHVKKVINFYRSPLRFAVDMGDWILYDNTGLKGTTADFAKLEFERYIPNKIERYFSNEENIENHLPQCNKVIYAVGFERRQNIIIKDVGHLTYCNKTGVIARGLYGFGIAFPEFKEDQFGIKEHRVGLWKFMDYLNRVLPLWMSYKPPT